MSVGSEMESADKAAFYRVIFVGMNFRYHFTSIENQTYSEPVAKVSSRLKQLFVKSGRVSGGYRRWLHLHVKRPKIMRIHFVINSYSDEHFIELEGNPRFDMVFNTFNDHPRMENVGTLRRHSCCSVRWPFPPVSTFNSIDCPF